MQTMLKIKKVKVCKRDYEEGLWIPKKVLKNHDLNSGEKKLLSLIIGLSKKCVCFATNKYFSEYFGQCLSSTQKQLRGLKEKGYIEIDQSAEIDERIGTTFRIVKVKKNDEKKTPGLKPQNSDVKEIGTRGVDFFPRRGVEFFPRGQEATSYGGKANKVIEKEGDNIILDNIILYKSTKDIFKKALNTNIKDLKIIKGLGFKDLKDLRENNIYTTHNIDQTAKDNFTNESKAKTPDTKVSRVLDPVEKIKQAKNKNEPENILTQTGEEKKGEEKNMKSEIGFDFALAKALLLTKNDSNKAIKLVNPNLNDSEIKAKQKNYEMDIAKAKSEKQKREQEIKSKALDKSDTFEARWAEYEANEEKARQERLAKGLANIANNYRSLLEDDIELTRLEVDDNSGAIINAKGREIIIDSKIDSMTSKTSYNETENPKTINNISEIENATETKIKAIEKETYNQEVYKPQPLSIKQKPLITNQEKKAETKKNVIYIQNPLEPPKENQEVRNSISLKSEKDLPKGFKKELSAAGEMIGLKIDSMVSQTSCIEIMDANTINNISEIEKPTEIKTEGIEKTPPKETLEKGFEDIWYLYPRKQGKTLAKKAYIRAMKEGVTPEVIKKGVVDFAALCKIKKTEYQYIPHGGTWFNQQRWLDDNTTIGYVKPRKMTAFEELDALAKMKQEAFRKKVGYVK